ncbi:MAG: glycosyltransferase family 4 protein [Phenylobacterium sp.]
MSQAALQLDVEAYDASIPKPMGRNSAGEGFLRGWLAHADVERFHFWNVQNLDRPMLEALLDRLGPVDRPVTWIPRGEREGLAVAGALYIPSPELRSEAWARLAFGGQAYSLTGVTHTIAETYILDEIAGMLTAPLEPWDALVCTSESGRKAVEVLLAGVAAYIQERFGAARIPPAQLVTIPLGVHTADFVRNPEARAGWRESFDIPQDAPVALHMGRFSTATKMHPGPMGLALQIAAERLGKPVYWIWFGGARRAEDGAAFEAAARAFCPDVEIRIAPDTRAETRDSLLSAADVFLSLSDNIQETFGLTPVEAMAAGLPCVVSDWDGYRDTVRHGVDGFRIRTTAPRPGLGGDLAYAYAQRAMSYDTYAGAAARLTSVDVHEAAEALTALFADPDLRARLGASAQARARESFDWRVVIPQYQALWTELARRRSAAAQQPSMENPYRPDPFRMFAGHPSDALKPSDVVSLARPFTLDAMTDHLARPGVGDLVARLPDAAERAAIFSLLSVGPRTVGALLAETSPDRRPFIERGLVWMAKFGVLRLNSRSTRT